MVGPIRDIDETTRVHIQSQCAALAQAAPRRAELAEFETVGIIRQHPVIGIIAHKNTVVGIHSHVIRRGTARVGPKIALPYDGQWIPVGVELLNPKVAGLGNVEASIGSHGQALGAVELAQGTAGIVSECSEVITVRVVLVYAVVCRVQTVHEAQPVHSHALQVREQSRAVSGTADISLQIPVAVIFRNGIGVLAHINMTRGTVHGNIAGRWHRPLVLEPKAIAEFGKVTGAGSTIVRDIGITPYIHCHVPSTHEGRCAA